MARRKPKSGISKRRVEAPAESLRTEPKGETTLPAGLVLSLAGGLLILFMLQGFAFIAANSQTSDEAVHLTAGYSYLLRRDFRLNPEHPPLIKELAALAVYLRFRLPFDPDPLLWRRGEQWRIGRNFLHDSAVPPDRILAWGRIPNLLLGMFLVGLVGWWAHRLWGPGAALLGMTLACLEPNLVAHSSLVTTDLGATLFGFLAIYLLWEYCRCHSWKRLVGVGVAVGLALASKYSSILLPGILGMIIVVLLLAGGELDSPGRRAGARRRRSLTERARAAFIPFSILLVIAVLVVPAAYFFQGFSTWWVGMGRVLSHQQTGHQAFFLGEYSSEGWLSYFPVAFLIKTPVGTLLLLLAALIFYRAGARPRWRDMVFLLVPVVIFFAAAARGRINIGLRHVLPIYPFLFVFASKLATLRLRKTFAVPVLLGIPLALTAFSSLRVAPHHLAYFNELVGGPSEGYRYLSDSNIDWGQGLKGLREFMAREGVPMIYLSYFGNAPPSAYGIRYQYVPAFGHLDRPPLDRLPPSLPRELLAVSVCSLQAVHYEDKSLYRWLYHREPIEKIGYSIYVYDITGDVEAHMRLAEVYLKLGPRSLAVPELEKVLALEPGHPKAARLLAGLSSSH